MGTKFVVWKFDVQLDKIQDVTEIEVSWYSEPLSVTNQNERLTFYFKVNPQPTENKPRTRRFRVAGTGHPIKDKECGAFLGTVMFRNGSFVLHVFDLGWKKG